jgi:tol-pal system protein YbgF
MALLVGAVAPAVAQSREEAQLAVRIQQLEEQIRLLTGQVEGLQFQLTQMQTMLEKQAEDNEFRFQQLEGGSPAPAAQTQGAVEPDRLPADPTTTAALPQVTPLALPASEQPMGSELGESADPLLGSNTMGTAALGELKLPDQKPLDPVSASAKVSTGDATAQYEAGYEAIMRGDYEFAEDQFQQFVALYPDDAHAADATNWLGEALMQRGAFDDAALVLAEGYQKYEASPRAPDLMLKLGMALAGAGEQDVACRTYFTLEKRYTTLAPAFVQRLHDEKSKAQCPA